MRRTSDQDRRGLWARCVAGATAGLLALAHCTSAHAQAPEEFFRGKTVNVIIGYSVGGGYDIYARLLARHLGRNLPGSPSVVAQNMPGAGSLKAIEYLLNVAPKDGLTVGTFGRSMPMAPLIEGAKFDATRLEWVGSIASDTTTCIAWHTSPVKTWADLKTKPFTVGGLGKGSDPEMFALIVRNLFQYNVKLVSGYPGTNDVALAMERGEVDGICGYSWSTLKASRKEWLAAKKITVLSQGALVRDKDLPDVPMMLDTLADERKKQTLTLLLAGQAMARPFAMPPGTAKDRVQAMRAAFTATMRDPQFIAEAKAGQLDIDPMTGEDMAALLAKVYGMPADIVQEAGRVVSN